jgi:hypothetical protein
MEAMDLVWSVWLFVAIPASFCAFEGYALAKNKTTLSAFVWKISKAFPPFGWIAGVLTGFLACHFWWGGAVCF